MCLWGTCAIDLCYLFYLICNTDARKRRTEMLEMYHKELEDTLKRLCFLGHIPTLHDLNMEILRNGAMGKILSMKFNLRVNYIYFFLEVQLCVSIMLFQFMDFSNMNTEAVYDIEEQFNIYRKAMRHPEYQKAMKVELPRLVSLGLIG